MKSKLLRKLSQVNKELWLVLSLFLIACLLNFVIESHRVILGLYTLPTLFSAYIYGRRHAIMTAVLSACMVGMVAHWNPGVLALEPDSGVWVQKWIDLTIWASTLVLTAYAMGTLYEVKEQNLRELRRSYHGILVILCQFVAKDKYTQNHSWRVSVYASKIAEWMGFDRERIEDVRAAGLLHDIGKLDVSREILYKASRLNADEYAEVSRHTQKGVDLLQSVGGSLQRVIPIVLAHHDKFDGSGQHEISGEQIPIEARILSVADVYDALTSDRPYRKAMSPFEAKETLVKGSGTDFDPAVIEAFLGAFRAGVLEVPEVMV
jgi:putative nucleotidyltransferase with HDIG domain